jgi:hypothetical protein
MVQHVIYILLWYLISYNSTKVKHHLTCFNNIFSNNELISNRFAVFVTCTHMLTYPVTFPVWRKHCIRRTMMEWLTLKWSATLLWLKPPLLSLFQIGLLFSLPVHTCLLTCETGYWSIFIYVYMTGCVKCHEICHMWPANAFVSYCAIWSFFAYL